MAHYNVAGSLAGDGSDAHVDGTWELRRGPEDARTICFVCSATIIKDLLKLAKPKQIEMVPQQ